ncbi:MAG TPA: archaetidylinositol phosphate synthase [Candidatus Krumholzibacteriaceae bacterium]|jgi:archaetidylinositol phosphate synthase|nr:archaetidylinositol phosphate synthase [Candidatus Krumholzibacteriaceae bacterium]
MLTKLKQQIQALLTREAAYAHRIGLTPNAVSGLGILLALLSAVTYWRAGINTLLLLPAGLFLLLSGFCDALDGVLARLYGQTTVFGGFLDSLLDRYADVAVLVGIVLGGFADVSWGFAAVAGTLLVSYVRARAEAAGVKMESIGIAERAERILILLVASLVALVWRDALWWSVVLLAFLTNITVLQRVIYFYRAVKKKTAV